MQLQLEINGRAFTWTADPADDLLRVLRRRGFWSPKYGCDSGDCGTCLVLVDGEPKLACLVPAARADGRRVTTVEALGQVDQLHPLQRAFLECGAVQCGYCTPAMLLAADALLGRVPAPSPTQVREALASVLCRCTGYVKPVQAVLRVASCADESEDGSDTQRSVVDSSRGGDAR